VAAAGFCAISQPLVPGATHQIVYGETSIWKKWRMARAQRTTVVALGIENVASFLSRETVPPHHWLPTPVCSGSNKLCDVGERVGASMASRSMG